VPADDRLGLHEQDRIEQEPEPPGQGSHQPSVERAPPRAVDLPADDDELLAQDQVLGQQDRPRRDEGQDQVEEEAQEGEHRTESLHAGPLLAATGP
jgi:hypothetical protein